MMQIPLGNCSAVSVALLLLRTESEELLQFVQHSTSTQTQQGDGLAWVDIAGAAAVRFDDAWLVLL